MNNHRSVKRISLSIIIISLAAIISVLAADSVSFTECESRCKPFAGDARYRCIKTCLSSKRKSDTMPDAKSGGTFKECESACSQLTGLEKIKCIRICMETVKSESSMQPNTKIEKPAALTECESRCGILTGDIREKCLLRCKKEKYGEYRDPLRFKK